MGFTKTISIVLGFLEISSKLLAFKNKYVHTETKYWKNSLLFKVDEVDATLELFQISI